MKTTLKMKAIARVVALASVGVALSGCVYDIGLGYASDGYYDDAYGCDPYSNYDRYYDCDYGHGFNNIGYGGGWFDNYYYPGYGFFLFDNIGRRYPMRDQHRRYWGEKRHNWYRENRGRDGDGGRYERRNRGYTDGGIPGAERHSSRVRDADAVQPARDGRREGRRARNDQWRGGGGTGAVPAPNVVAPQRQGRGQSYGDDYRPSNRRGDREPEGNNVPTPPQQVSPIQQNVASGGQPPKPRGEEQGLQTLSRQRMPEGGVERPE